MRCPKCGADNRDVRKFCAKCAAPLARSCPECGASNEPGEDFCGECAAPLGKPSASSAKKASNGPILIAETSASENLEGERKTITVLFADIKGSMSQIENLDPEAARAMVDPALAIMAEAVNRYQGHVAQSTGDGVFALFGAPIAHEDHPQRAIYAAIRMQEELRRYSDRLRADGKVPVEIRIGINTGEVVMRSVGKDQSHSEYLPAGHAVGLASRLQAIAPTGSIALSEHTRRLVEGYFQLKSLGPTQIKGATEAVNVHEVLGLGPLRTRLQRSASRGLSRFVGREAEIAQMKRALEQAKSGRGQIVAAMAEPGVGKSRLFFEFKPLAQSGCMVLEALSISHGKASPYLPVLDLLRSYFEISFEDDARKRREKVNEKLLTPDRALEETIPYLFSLLGIVEEADPLAGMDVQIKRRRTLDAIKRILLRESQSQPLIVIFEDLHWIDGETQALLNLLVESIGNAKVLLLVSYRPEYHHEWGNKTYYTQLRLDPLGTESAHEMLDALLGDGRELVPLKRVIVEKTEGNPFFMEEIVQALFEQEALVHDGAVKLAKSLSSIQIPPTVQAVLASRIDRLPLGVKDLLNMLAVIGKEFPLGLVRHIAGKPDHELQHMLMVLQAAEFIYEQPAFPDVAYVFKHALSQQVAYGSTLQERRKVLHERIANVLEAHFPETVETQPELIAHHYTQAGHPICAVPYWRRAGERSLEMSANLEAVNHLNNGLRLIDSLPGSIHEHTALREHHCGLLYLLGTAQKRSGNPLDSHDTLLNAAKEAQELGSSELLVNALLQFTMNSYEVGLPLAPAIPLMRAALVTLPPDDRLSRAKCLNALARALVLTGSTQEALAYAREGLAMARRLGDPESIARNLGGMAYALQSSDHAMERLEITTEMVTLSKHVTDWDLLHDTYSFRTLVLFEAGDREEAEAAIERYRSLAEESRNPFDIALNTVHRAAWAFMQGGFAEAERFAEQAFAIGRQLHAERASGVFGLQMFSLRREQGRLRELEPLIKYFLAQHKEAAAWRPGLAVIFSELGRRQDARDQFEHLARFDFADIPRDSMWMGTMTYLADVCSFLNDRPRAAELYRLLLPYAHLNVVIGSAAVCYGAVSRYLGSLAATLERWDDAQRHFDHALTKNAAFGARPFLAHTQYQYGAMLLANDQPGDSEKAAALLKDALATARELGMRALEDQVTSGRP